ncbi:MAG: hypothetical protein K1X67_17130 [Fimbriimonadaceae bacterium]|nr:hypothetical protein [Fimbriimonadaceae bacterium]
MNSTQQQAEQSEMLETLVITRAQPRTMGVGGVWVSGTIAGHRFEALVFEGHAADPGFELEGSRISKLWLAVAPRGDVVASFERGWDLEPTTTAAAAIVDLFIAGLAEHVFGH